MHFNHSLFLPGSTSLLTQQAAQQDEGWVLWSSPNTSSLLFLSLHSVPLLQSEVPHTGDSPSWLKTRT